MKRFLIFGGMSYYPSGGWGDFKEDFNTYVEALEYAADLRDDWWQILDTETKKVVRTKGQTADAR